MALLSHFVLTCVNALTANFRPVQIEIICRRQFIYVFVTQMLEFNFGEKKTLWGKEEMLVGSISFITTFFSMWDASPLILAKLNFVVFACFLFGQA